MAATKIEYEEKIGLIPYGVRVNQVQDLDMNEIKKVVNKNADELNAKQSNLGYAPENVANKVTSIGLSANDTNYPSELAVKTYADNLVVGMLNDRGTWDASINAFPTTGGSGVGGAIRKGDMWYISVAGTLGTKSVNVGDSFRVLVNAPAQVAANWSILEANIGYVPANDANVVHLAGAETITGVKSFSPSISAVTGSAKGTIINPTLTATANNDVLVGLDVAPTFKSGGFTGVKNISARFNGVSDVRASSMGSKFSFGDGSLYFGWNNGNYLDIISAGGLRVGNQASIKMQFYNDTGSLILQSGGTFTDDGINRLQVSGTVSSGTGTLGNTPPTANNQLTRKDYVDSGLALKANLASSTFTGAVTATSFINSTAPATNVLLAGGTTLANPISGTGTTNYLPKFTSAGVVGNSNIYDDGTNVLSSAKMFSIGGQLSDNWNGYANTLKIGQLIYNDYTTLPQGTLAFNSYYDGINQKRLSAAGAVALDFLNSGDFAISSDIARAAGYVTTLPTKLVVKSDTGNILINTTTDNGVDKLQVNGSAKFTNSGLQGTFIGSDQGAIDLRRGTTQGFRLFSDINGFGIYDLINNLPRLTIKSSTGAAKFSSSVTANGDIYAIGTITATNDLVALSDAKLKTNVRNLGEVIPRIKASRGVLYDRIDGTSVNNIGFIAQELQVNFPELISTDKDGTLGVKYQNAVAILFEAIKEQQKQIDDLKELVYKLIK